MVLLPEESEVTLAELRELAARQQQQIEAQQQLLVAKEQRLKFLKQQEARHHQGAQATETERIRPLRDKVESQELKLRRLRALRGQAEQQRASNNNLTAELESIRALFNEKEKELSLAVAKVEELTRQLEELRRGNVNGMFADTNPSNPNALSVVEVEKLRRELLYRTKLNEQQNAKILLQRETLAKRQEEISLIDQRIAGLQQRLHRKRTLNQQLASQIHAATLAKQAQISPTNNNMANHPVNQSKPATRIMRPMTTNIAAVEPLKRIPQETCQDDLHATLKAGDEDMSEFMLNKNDPKYQTLPYNTKFLLKPHSREGSLDEANEKNKLIINNNKGKSSDENSPSSSPPAIDAPPPPSNPAPSKMSLPGQNLANLAPRPFGSTYSSTNLGSMVKGPNAPSPTTSQSSNTSSNSPAYKPFPSQHSSNGTSFLPRSKLPTPTSSSSPSNNRLLQNGHLHSPTFMPSSPSKSSSLQRTNEYCDSVQSPTHGHSDGSSPDEGSPSSDNGNENSKPALPPKPLLPVKPVPPPRQTHVVGIVPGNNNGNGTKKSDVDSALMVLKSSTAKNTKSGNGYRYVMKPPTHNYPSRLPVGSSAMDQYAKAINHVYRNEMQNHQQQLSSSSDKSESDSLPDCASMDNEGSKRLGSIQMPIQARPLTIKKPSGLDPPRLRTSSSSKRLNEVTSPSSQLSNLTGLQLSGGKKDEDCLRSPNGIIEAGEDTTDKAFTILSSPIANKSFTRFKEGIEGSDTLQKEIDLLVDRFNGNTHLDPEGNLDSQQSNSELGTEDENELLSDSRKSVSTRSDSSSETAQHDDSEGSYSGLMVNNSAVFRRVKKGNLKTKGSAKNPRRVSFDPLALLLDASLEGELELVKKTAREVTNPSAANDEGITALHNAICAGHLEIVKFLVEFGCDVNAQDSDGWTPLHCAASCNNLPMVKFLVEHGACIFATTLSDHETAAEKCEEEEEGFDGCSEYLYSIQEKLGILNGGAVYGVYDYEAQNPDELSFKEGEMLVILRKGDDLEREWWWSKLRDREGYIPRNLLGLQPRVTPRKEQ